MIQAPKEEEQIHQAKTFPLLSCTTGNPAGDRTKLLPQESTSKRKVLGRSGLYQYVWGGGCGVFFLFSSQSEILNPTLSLFLGGTR